MGLGIHKARRRKPPSPGVRTTNELDGRILGHRVQRYPKADDVLAVYGVAGLVVVLGGALFGARLFDQNMFVVQIDFGRVHELRRQLLDGRLKKEVAVGVNALPVAIVTKKTARVALGRVVLGVGSKRIGAMNDTTDSTKLTAMAQVKQLLDPQRLMNPGKLFTS